MIGIAGPGGVVLGGGSRVERVSVEGICGYGISAGITSSVVESRVRLATANGITVGNASRVAGVIADFNGLGISTGEASTVSDSIATTSQGGFPGVPSGYGMLVRRGTVVSNSSVSGNAEDGLLSWDGGPVPILVLGSYFGSNAFGGLFTHSDTGLGANVFNGNFSDGANAGVLLGCNSADGINYCPSHP